MLVHNILIFIPLWEFCSSQYSLYIIYIYNIIYLYIIFNSVISLTQFTRWLGRKLQRYLPKVHRHRGRNMGQGQQTIPGSCLTQRATRDPWLFAWTITSFSSIIRDFGSPGISSLCFLSLTTNKQTSKNTKREPIWCH